MKRRLSLACAVVCLVHATSAFGDVDPAANYTIETLRSEGLERTAPETITELLPRPLPASLSGAELVELRRRIKNLALFDQVDVDAVGTTLLVRVRRKFTISPIVDLSIGIGDEVVAGTKRLVPIAWWR